MNPKLLMTTGDVAKPAPSYFVPTFLINRALTAALLSTILVFTSSIALAQWTPLSNLAPDPNLGVMLLLSNGTVMCKTSSGGGDGIGNTWNLLTPDIHGSYANGTWSTIAPMNK